MGEEYPVETQGDDIKPFAIPGACGVSVTTTKGTGGILAHVCIRLNCTLRGC